MKQLFEMWLLRLRSVFASVFHRRKSCYLGEFNSPKGHDTGITVYNSSANKKVPLTLRRKGIATWYMCGPTVYDETHIGHACCYIKIDIIRRIMEKVFGIKVFLQMGITDIDDKIIKASQQVSDLGILEVARKYELDFYKGMAGMRVLPPTSVTRVTENIPQIISFCEKLIEKDFAYVTSEGNVYFKVAKSVSAEVSSEWTEEVETNIDPLKIDRRDFALWKAKEDEPCWISPWGKGRPGWHIECSVMASKIFGSHLDLHSGGYDLLFPHHSNEKSQSEAFHGCSQWGNYWLHAGLLQVENETKMSKSIKNTVTIKQFLKEHSANDFRIMCLQSPYRKNILYCHETLAGAKGLHKKFHNFMNEIDLYCDGQMDLPAINEDKLLSRLQSTETQINTLLADDFNTPKALLCLTDLIDSINETLQSSKPAPVFEGGITAISACANYVNRMLEIFGIEIMYKKKMNIDYVHFINAVTEFRSKVRLLALHQIELGEMCPTDYIVKLFMSYKQKYYMINHMREIYKEVNPIYPVIENAYEKCYKFCNTLEKSNVPFEGKERAAVLTICDEFRLNMEKQGIAIKDRKGGSTWCLKL